MNHSDKKLGYYHLTMKLKDFSTILVVFICANSWAQNQISGNITSGSGQNIGSVSIYNKTDGTQSFSDKDGFFELKVSNSEEKELVFYKEKFLILEKKLSVSTKNVIVLEEINNLSEVVINAQREKLFALDKMKDVDETAIYAGKKTEVISLDKITANKATNNTRQIFGQIVGLTINEGSDGGLQLSIGGRGLNPNRTSNFNTRQNGYDISADVLGYPESYYATPTEGLEEIQIIRGAASLQYGTQFGGLVNFKMKSPSKKPIELVTRTTLGSYNLFTNFTSLSGTNGKFSYYTFYNYKKGDGFRPNSEFESKNYFANLNYQFNEKTSLHFDYTYFHYLAQQAGGLTDSMFEEDPKQSNRSRNWFAVDWNLFALRLKHKFDNNADFSLQLFGLDASRKTVGYRSNRVSSTDVPNSVRDLIVGDFVNWGAEARYLKKYQITNQTSVFLIGAKYYQSENSAIQGPGSKGSGANFNLAKTEFPLYANQSDYSFPNLNVSVFGENIFKITSKFSITPGFRFEKIRTKAEGSYQKINLDLAGNLFFKETIVDNNLKDRSFLLLGLGLSYKPYEKIEFYGNISQNYRSVTFNDIRTVNPGFEIDENITDEKGYTSDIGIRGKISNKISFDASIFGLLYDHKIGEYFTRNTGGDYVSYRDNIGTAITYGLETLIDWSVSRTFFKQNQDFVWSVFSNVAITNSKYLKSEVPDNIKSIKGNEVEFVPQFNIKTGTGIGYKNFMSSLQFTYLSSQFTSANPLERNTINDGISGPIPSYYVADFSASYKLKNWKLEAGINNFTDNSYFTRRATGYPGPGIIPSDSRTFYSTLQFTF